MRSSRIKQYSSRLGVDWKRTDYHVRCSFCRLCSHVVDSATGEVLLAPVSLHLLLVPILSLLRSGPLVFVVLSFLGAGISIVPRVTAVETGPRGHWCVVSLGEARGLTCLRGVLQS